MRKQTRDIVSIAIGIFGLFFILEMLVVVPLYGLAFLLGHGYPFRQLIFFSVFGVIVGELFVFFPLAFFTTRHLKGDPFRFSPKLKAYFRIPESSVDLQALLESLKNSFPECKIENSTQLRASWNPPGCDDGLQTFHARNARRSRQRSIVIEPLRGWQGFREQRVEVSVETGSPIKLLNGDGLNQFALQSLMITLGWEKYRIVVDTEGHPQWQK
jgi:hypothetical protein